uniref:EF-hand domain-containing protein n=1 Tax=Strigamia maritima TaxID=126957 RepID=T1J5U2_STRMM
MFACAESGRQESRRITNGSMKKRFLFSTSMECQLKKCSRWRERWLFVLNFWRRFVPVYSWQKHLPRSSEHESDELEMHVVRYKPDGLDALCRNTKFSKKELQFLYRGFKQECPSGIVNEETFKSIYAQFFPQGDVSHYAEYVFKTFDHDHSGAISFEDFVVGLSVLSRGSLNEKLQWTFNLYDINGDGFITKDELYDIVTSIYDLVGNKFEANMEETATRNHVDRVFQMLDLNKDGVITMDEFIDSLSKDAGVVKSLGNLDTIL